MSKIAVIYWSQTGNTESMANAVAEGAKEAGAEVSLMQVSQTNANDAASYDKIALGCPAMGAEVLEEEEFQPFYDELEGKLSGKKVALFGSYGWGDGEWMRNWQDSVKAAGAQLCGGEGLMINNEPDADGIEQCKALGKALAQL